MSNRTQLRDVVEGVGNNLKKSYSELQADVLGQKATLERIFQQSSDGIVKDFKKGFEKVDSEFQKGVNGALRRFFDPLLKRLDPLFQIISKHGKELARLFPTLTKALKWLGKALPIVSILVDVGFNILNGLEAREVRKAIEAQNKQLDELVFANARIGRLEKNFNKLVDAVNKMTVAVDRMDRRVEPMAGRLNVIQSSVRVIDGKVTPLRGGINTIQSGIRTIDGKLNRVPTTANITSAVRAAVPTTANITSAVRAAVPTTANITSAVRAAVPVVNAADVARLTSANLSPSLSNISNTLNQIRNNPQRVDLSPLFGRFDGLSAQINRLPSNNLAPLTSQLNAIQQQQQSILNRVSQPSSIDTQLRALDQKVTALPSQIRTASVDFSPVLGAIATLGVGVAAVRTINQGIDSKLSLQTPKIDALGNDVKQINAKLDRPQTAVLSPNALDPIKTEIRASEARMTNATNRNAVNLGRTIEAIEINNQTRHVDAVGRLSTVDAKLGTQIPNGGISGFMQRTWQVLQMDRVLNVLTLITVIHNAAMLSRSLVETLGDTISLGLSVIGIKGEGGSPIDINAILGQQANAFMASILGDAVWRDVVRKWQAANRTYQAAANILWNIRSMGDSSREVMEWTAENTGRIGNALKRYGVVGEDAYRWMPENVNAVDLRRQRFQRVTEGLESLDDAASSLQGVVGEVSNIQQEYQQFQENKAKFNQQLKELAPVNREDNTPVKDSTTQAKTQSQSPAIAESDLQKQGGDS